MSGRMDAQAAAERASGAMSALLMLVLHHDGDIEPRPLADLLDVVFDSARSAMPLPARIAQPANDLSP